MYTLEIQFRSKVNSKWTKSRVRERDRETKRQRSRERKIKKKKKGRKWKYGGGDDEGRIKEVLLECSSANLRIIIICAKKTLDWNLVIY